MGTAQWTAGRRRLRRHVDEVPASATGQKASSTHKTGGARTAGSTQAPPWGILAVAGLVVAAVGLRQVSNLIAPLFLAVTLVISVEPLRSRLVRLGVPGVLATTTVILSVYLIIVAVIGSVVWSITQLVQLVPQYSAEMNALYQSSLNRLTQLGFGQSDLDALLQKFDPSQVIGVVQSLAGQVSGWTSLVVLLLTSVVFLAGDAAGFGDRLRAVADSRPGTARGLRDFGERVRQYWLVSSVFGLIVAVLDVIALMIIGVPLALTWGVLSFVTNYIPNIGFVLGLIPPALIALLEGGVPMMLWVVVVYSALNVVIQTFIQPRFTGDAAGINPTVTFISLLVWAYLLGPLGALLAVPATLLLKSVMVDQSPSHSWLGALIGAEIPQQQPVSAA
ncbi:MAG: AI-2E family transporter [Micrococcales bacterium]|nr:MAG: AI-2E family transporter [Micrococcales bacterium]